MVENSEEQAKRLVIDERLPPSGIDRKFVKVERDHTVFHSSVPPALGDLKAPEWKKAAVLKSTFTKPATGKQRKRQQSPLRFPFCLLVFGPAATSLQERLIVINWWLNLTKEEQDAVWKKLNKYFCAPNVSAELLNQYDPKKPKAIGMADTLELRKNTSRGESVIFTSEQADQTKVSW